MSRSRARRTVAALPYALIVSIALLISQPAAAQCTGDCDDNGDVAINEIIRAVGIALGQLELTQCTAIDQDESGDVSISELIAAVNFSLDGCPGAPTQTPRHTGTQTPTASPSGTPTPTATINQPLVPPTASVYRTFPGFPIGLPIGVTDPDGGPVTCTVENLPAGASFNAETNVLSWTPAEDQLGPFYVPFACADDATPPESVSGTLTFRVAARDACSIPTCDPATGCTVTLPPADQPCCGEGPAARVAEPFADCPAGRVMYVGQNGSVDSFGRIQNCDVMRLTNFAQADAELQFHVEARCMNALNRMNLVARMESSSPSRPLVFNASALPSLYAQDDDGFARRRNYRLRVDGGGPFFDLEGAEANLFLTLRDSSNQEVTHQVRVRLSFTPQPDLPDVDPPPPTPTPPP